MVFLQTSDGIIHSFVPQENIFSSVYNSKLSVQFSAIDNADLGCDVFFLVSAIAH